MHEVGLLRGLTVEALRVLLPEVEEAAKHERENDPFGNEDDPRNLTDRWLDHVFYLHLAKAGPAEGALTSSVSLADLTSMLAGDAPPKIVLTDATNRRAGRKVRVSFPPSAHASVDVLCKSTEDLAAVASYALRKVDDPRCFVRVEGDPRFLLASLETLYLLVTPEQVRALVELGILRDDEEISDIVEPIAGPPVPYLEVQGIAAAGEKAKLQSSVLAMPRGGDWEIQGRMVRAPQGPHATNLSGHAYARLYKIKGWQPSPRPTSDTFSAKWEMVPGALLAILDGGDDAERASERVQAALDELKSAACNADRGAPTALPEPPEVAMVTAQIGAAELLVRRRGTAMAIVVRDGLALEPGEAQMPLEPGDTVVLGTDLGAAVTRDEIAAVAAKPGNDGPVSSLLERAAKGGAVRPALLIARVALRQRNHADVW
ncbi:hypothetical protein QHF89_47800 [Polyangium sorediatum]|uniref:RCK C-terminal domain-containing protein n=2 Tax=Polyangium sorediatum TaxID=889274 RepID=A0ABT6P9J9_9BACT|nr:hypothetical protein [Polyangium sorediatum]